MTEIIILNDIRQTISHAQTWEYASYQTTKPKDAFKDFLEQYGSDGWELVNVIYTSADEG